MEYKVTINDFEGPMDLLLHLVKENNIDIIELNVEEITEQYLKYIEEAEELNLDIASEYLTLAAELIEIKSMSLLPKKVVVEDDYEEDPRENLIARLIEYQKYKEVTKDLKELEEQRKHFYSKSPSNLKEFKENEEMNYGDLTMDLLMNAFQKFLDRKEEEKPLNTKITKKEYSVSARSREIKDVLKKRKKVEFEELFEIVTKDYVVVTFLSILSMAKKGELIITQNDNFSKIVLSLKEGE
ncbi:MAG: segregation/condensation protein A [Tenericutes bacterium]|nr:segregation/condensation protein A [Mycoplasmatota bacterium]